MKYRKKLFLFILFLIICGQAFGISSYAAADSAQIGEMEKYIPKEALEMLPEGIFENNGEGAVDKFSFSYFFSLILKTISNSLGTAIISLSTLLGIVIISSLFHMLADSYKISGLKDAFTIISSLCTCVAIFDNLVVIFGQVQGYFTTLCSFANTMTPFITLIYTIGGNLTGSIVASNGLLVCMTVLENINTYALYPILQISAGLTLARAAAPKLRLGSISNFIRGILSLSISLIVAAISAIMTFQSSLASSVDSLGARAVKFAAASFIPVVGSAVSEAVRTMSSSIAYVRTTVGAIGIVAIVAATLPIFVTLTMSRINLALAASLADLLGCEGECKAMKEAGGLINFLIALVSLMAVLFIYSLTLLVRCTASYG